MSSEQAQSAMVELIRYPELNRGTALDAFLQKFQLTSYEKSQLISLAKNSELLNYGVRRRLRRFQKTIQDRLPISVRTLGLSKLEKIFYDDFEVLHPKILQKEVADKFAAYFEEWFSTLAKKYDIPAFGIDLLKFEYADSSLRKGRLLDCWLPRYDDSYLQPGVSLIILELSYDIIPFLELAQNEAIVTEAQYPRLLPNSKTILLSRIPHVSDGGQHIIGNYEIDAELKKFFEEQLLSNTRISREQLPACYTDLVAAGICIA